MIASTNATELEPIAHSPSTIYIVGPTASGKTALSVELAKEFDAEIVCADSQTVRRGMDVGTAKPTAEERQGIAHHMLDVINPYDDYSLDEYLGCARNIINDIHKRNKPVLVVGGTGLYVDALYFNFSLPKIHAFESDLTRLTTPELQKIISDRDLRLPANENNPRHLINVILRGENIGVKTEPDPASLIIGIYPGREKIIERINDRVDVMFDAGFVREVEGVIARYGRPPKQFDAIGYRIVMRLIDGEITEPEARELFKIADRQYAKRQMAWFKRNKDIKWFESPADAKNYILEVA